MTPLVADPSGYLKPHHSVGHCQRHNRLLLAGWDVLNFTWDDYSRRPHQLCAAVAAAGAPLKPARPK